MKRTFLSYLTIVSFLLCGLLKYSKAQNPFYINVNPMISQADLITRTTDKGYILRGGSDFSTGVNLAYLKLDSMLNFQWKKTFLNGGTYYYGSKGFVKARPQGGFYAVDVWGEDTYGLAKFGVMTLDDYGNNINDYSVFSGFDVEEKIYGFDVNKINGDYIFADEYIWWDTNNWTIISNKSHIKSYDSLHTGKFSFNSDLLIPGTVKYNDVKYLYFPNNSVEVLVVGDHFAMKIDNSQNILWQKSYTDSCNGIIVQDDSSCFVFQQKNDAPRMNTEIRKMDYYGNIIFNKTINDVQVIEAAISDSSHLLLSGIYQGGNQRIILKTDNQLNIINAFLINSLANSFTREVVSIDTTDESFLSSHHYYVSGNIGDFRKNYLDTSCLSVPVTVSITNFSSSSQSISHLHSLNVPTSLVGPMSGSNFWPLQISYYSCNSSVGVETLNANPLSLLTNLVDEHIVFERIFLKNDRILLLNSIGQTVYSKEIKPESNKLDIDVSHLNNGLYIMNLITGNRIHSKKIVINH